MFRGARALQRHAHVKAVGNVLVLIGRVKKDLQLAEALRDLRGWSARAGRCFRTGERKRIRARGCARRETLCARVSGRALLARGALKAQRTSGIVIEKPSVAFERGPTGHASASRSPVTIPITSIACPAPHVSIGAANASRPKRYAEISPSDAEEETMDEDETPVALRTTVSPATGAGGVMVSDDHVMEPPQGCSVAGCAVAESASAPSASAALRSICSEV